MKFFKKMNEKELFNSNRAMTFGFCSYMLITAINYFYYLLTAGALISPSYIFGSGLLAAVTFEFMLNLKDKFERKEIE